VLVNAGRLAWRLLWPCRVIRDAEITIGEAGGKPSFERLRKRANTRASNSIGTALCEHPARLYAFDSLVGGDADLSQRPLAERKERLRDSFENTAMLIYVSGVEAVSEWVWSQVPHHGPEGMLSKRLDSRYQRGRSRDWLKIKYAAYDRPAALDFRKK
jgi:bifunctional non-homologous end joining protein LigD